MIRNTTDKEVAIQISDAEKQAEILEAEGEAEYMRVLSEAYARCGTDRILHLCPQPRCPKGIHEGRRQDRDPR